MPNVRASSGMIGTIRGPMCSSRARLRSSRVKPIVVETAWLPEPAAQLGERLVGRQLERAADARRALRDLPAERLATLHHVLVLDGVLRRAVVRQVVGVDVLLGDLVLEEQPVAERDQLVLGHLLDLVGRVAALEALAERPALDRLAEDDGRGARCRGSRWRPCRRRTACGSRGRRGAGCAARRRSAWRRSGAARVGPEEVLADVVAVLDGVALELAVDRGVHLVQRARRPCPWRAARPTSCPRSP